MHVRFLPNFYPDRSVLPSRICSTAVLQPFSRPVLSARKPLPWLSACPFRVPVSAGNCTAQKPTPAEAAKRVQDRRPRMLQNYSRKMVVSSENRGRTING